MQSGKTEGKEEIFPKEKPWIGFWKQPGLLDLSISPTDSSGLFISLHFFSSLHLHQICQIHLFRLGFVRLLNFTPFSRFRLFSFIFFSNVLCECLSAILICGCDATIFFVISPFRFCNVIFVYVIYMLVSLFTFNSSKREHIILQLDRLCF